MSCSLKIAKDVLNSCDDIPRAGLEPVAWVINREDIDTVTYDSTVDNLVEAITLNSGTYAYQVTAVKKEGNAGFDLSVSDDTADTYLNYFSFKPYEADAESVKNIDDMQDIVVIAELKGSKTEGCFVIYGLENGLYKSSGTQRRLDNNGLPIYEFQTEEGQGERYSRFVFWDTDYATSKTVLEALIMAYGPELNTTANATSDSAGAEADATTGWTEQNLNGTGSNVFESQSAVKNVGSYALHADCTDTPTSLARFYLSLSLAPFSLINGDRVKLSFDIRHTGTGVVTGTWEGRLASSNTGLDHPLISVSKGDTTWQPVEITFTYDSTYRDLVFIESNSGNEGGVYVDNLSVKRVL